MTPVQCRMARAALHWSIDRLAMMADSNKTSIVKFEKGRRCHRVTRRKLQQALVGTGVIRFVGDNGIYVIDK